MSAAGQHSGVCGTLIHMASAPVDASRALHLDTFLDLSNGTPLLALCCGELGGDAPVLARVHSSCMTSETFGGCDCDCADQLAAAVEAIAARGRGAIFYLLQEGRGAGFIAKARDRMMVQASSNRVTTFDAYARMGLGRDYRRYDAVGFAAAALGITAPLALLTNNPEKLAALRRAGVAIDHRLPLERAASPFNRDYLAAKSQSGHALRQPMPVAAAAALPEPVTYFDPHPLAERPRFVRVASYLLPIRSRWSAPAVHWFRLHAYFDRATQRARVLFTYARTPDATPLVGAVRESFLERLPVSGRCRGAAWTDAVDRIVQRGAGTVLFLLHDDPSLADGMPDASAVIGADGDLAWLLASHVPARSAELLPAAPAACAVLADHLARHGVAAHP